MALAVVRLPLGLVRPATALEDVGRAVGVPFSFLDGGRDPGPLDVDGVVLGPESRLTAGAPTAGSDVLGCVLPLEVGDEVVLRTSDEVTRVDVMVGPIRIDITEVTGGERRDDVVITVAVAVTVIPRDVDCRLTRFLGTSFAPD